MERVEEFNCEKGTFLQRALAELIDQALFVIFPMVFLHTYIFIELLKLLASPSNQASDLSIIFSLFILSPSILAIPKVPFYLLYSATPGKLLVGWNSPRI